MKSDNKNTKISGVVNLLAEFSIPLLSGVVIALFLANFLGEGVVNHYLHLPLLGPDITILGHELSFYFIINDIFMVLFFGIAAVEITQAVIPGGSLNPITRALNPILGTIGGIVGPVLVYISLAYFFELKDSVYKGWAIPIATDIALAWLVARFVFGKGHPAISYLLLLAIADDALGLGIIAVFYSDPAHPVQPLWLLLTLTGMLIAYFLRYKKVSNFWYYLLLGGVPSWLGLLAAHLHPALALIFIVPFMPSDLKKHEGLFDEEQESNTISNFEHFFKIPVDFGLFCFGLANSAIAFSGIGDVTWLVLSSLFFGKTIGVFLFSYIGELLGLKIPQGMGHKHIFVVAIIAGIGLTVALFIAGIAFMDPELEGAGKMGALFSIVIALPAIFLGIVFKLKKLKK